MIRHKPEACCGLHCLHPDYPDRQPNLRQTVLTPDRE